MNAPLILERTAIVYPSSDGAPLGETAIHVDAILDWYGTIQVFFMDEPRVMVLSNVFLYYQEGNATKRRAPDVMVIKDVAKEQPDSYLVWVYGKAPDVIFEFTSEGTWEDDLGTKKVIYERLQVKEYVIYDPKHQYLDQPLIGFRLGESGFEDIPIDQDGGLVSRELGLKIYPDGNLLRGVNLRTGERLLHAWEREVARRADQQAAERARERADEERRRADAEKARANEALAEVARLQALLEKKQGSSDKS